MEKLLSLEALVRSGDGGDSGGSCGGGLLPLSPATATTLQVVATAAIAAVSLVMILRRLLSPAALRRPLLRNPLKTVIPRMTQDQIGELVYPPDFLPGARDVDTPYGSIRVYEWGPEDGPRVLFLHGISTSCITLASLAHGMVRRGCRVMLFDLFGRGYSDGVGDLPHDARLYVAQALMATASSPLSWTGRGALRLVGYSMGAGIAVHLAAAFPELVSSLVLIAPAGLIRPTNFGFSRHLFRSGLVPERLLAALTRRRLQRPIASKKAAAHAAQDEQGEQDAAVKVVEELVSEDIIDVGIAEAADPNAMGGAVVVVDDDGDRGMMVNIKGRVLGYVQWMVLHHEGFLSAFMSSVRHAPLAEQEASWKEMAKRPRGTTALILGRRDEIIHLDQYVEDALPLVGGKDHVRWTVLPGAHDIPMTHAREILAEIDELWRTQFG